VSERRVQDDTFRCEHCGQLATVVPGGTPYEFEVECVCGRSYMLSWDHAEPPPQFVRAQQQRLPDVNR